MSAYDRNLAAALSTDSIESHNLELAKDIAANQMGPRWELLAKRMIALNNLGLFIEQSDGHRWLRLEYEVGFTPACLMHITCEKVYGSYVAALDYVDGLLIAAGRNTLELHFESQVNYYNDLTNIFGAGTQ